MSCSALSCDQIVEGLDLRIEDFEISLTVDPELAFRCRLACLYCLVKLMAVGATNLVGMVKARSTLTRISPTNASGVEVERSTAIPRFHVCKGD